MSSNPTQRSVANQPAADESTLIFAIEDPGGGVIVDKPLGIPIEELAAAFMSLTVDRFAIRGILFTCAAGAVGAPVRIHPVAGATAPSITIDPGDKLYVPFSSLPDRFLVTEGAAECVMMIFF